MARIVLYNPQGLYSELYSIPMLSSYFQIWYLEHRRDLELHRLAKLIQRAFRKYYKTYGVHILHKAQVIIASYYRAYRGRKDFQRKRDACILIAAYFKGWKVTTLFLHRNVYSNP